jgi:RimJ/RimL family protein N-acetyltransferase
MFRIDGKRIYLRDHRASDLEAYHAWLSNPIVTRYLSWRVTTEEESLIRLSEGLQEIHKRPRLKYFLAVALKENDHIIGEAGFTIQSRNETGGIAEIGYFFLQEHWGKGYATEAAGLLIEYCFSQLGLHKVIATCDAENRASESVMKKCSMQREAHQRKHALLDGEWRDRLGYAIFYEDWIKQRNLSK